MVICLEPGADLNMAQLMPLPLTVSCFIKIQIGFTFLVPAHLGSPGKRAVKRVCVCMADLHYMANSRPTILQLTIDAISPTIRLVERSPSRSVLQRQTTRCFAEGPRDALCQSIACRLLHNCTHKLKNNNNNNNYYYYYYRCQKGEISPDLNKARDAGVLGCSGIS